MTPRQHKLLQAIINEFIQSAEAVGSMNLVNKYSLDVSSATIRNEMAELMRQGLLSKPHSSAGRVPTTLGYKSFVEDLQEDIEEPGVTIANLIRQELFNNRFDTDDLIYSALNALVEQTENVALALIGNRIYHAGLSRIPTFPEYRQVQGLCNLISVMEDRITLKEILTRNSEGHKVRILFGVDTGLEVFSGMVIIYSPVDLYERNTGYVGVIGPERIDYTKVIPTVDYIAGTMENVIGGWR